MNRQVNVSVSMCLDVCDPSHHLLGSFNEFLECIIIGHFARLPKLSKLEIATTQLLTKRGKQTEREGEQEGQKRTREASSRQRVGKCRRKNNTEITVTQLLQN